MARPAAAPSASGTSPRRIKFWQDGKHANHGFFLHGDSNDYMRMYTPKAKNLKQRPAVMVIYEPKP